MKKTILYKILFVSIVISANIACDQITKSIARKEIAYSERIPVIGRYVTLTKVENTGAFLSMGNTLSRPLYIILMIILPIALILYGIYYIVTSKNISPYLMIGLCFAIGGGLGNIYDRIVYGSVTDFMHIDFVLFETGIFNMADVSVMIGMFILLIDFYINKKKTTKE